MKIYHLVLLWVLGNYHLVNGQNKDANLDISLMIQSITQINVFEDPDYYHWGGSIIKGEDERYHLFYSRWKKELGFAAWLTFSEIAHATSSSPNGPWKFEQVELTGEQDGKWDEITAHNPKIKYFEGTYYLYYIGTHLQGLAYDEQTLINTHGKGLGDLYRGALRRNQRTGVAVSQSLYGPWIRSDQPLIEPSGPITTLTVNPAIDKGHDGRYYLIVKGDKPMETRFIRNQAVAIGDSPLGPFELLDKPVIGNLDTEDASLWYDEVRETYFAIYHAHTYIGLIESKDGEHWYLSEHNKVMQKQIRFKTGEILRPYRMERPFIYVENGLPRTLCLAVLADDHSKTVFIPLDF
ncbi:MAG: glycoside hydrolase family protein [Flavobacteriaceae bacterium]